MMPANPLYSVQPSSPYLGPGAFPLADLQSYAGHAPRHALSQTLSQSQMLPSISASPPSSFQISPPLHPHQQLSLHQSSLLNQPIGMQQVQSQPIIPHQMGLQASLHSPPPGQQVNLGDFFFLGGISPVAHQPATTTMTPFCLFPSGFLPLTVRVPEEHWWFPVSRGLWPWPGPRRASRPRLGE